MSRDERPKASEVRGGPGIFRQPAPFEEVYPKIRSANVTITDHSMNKGGMRSTRTLRRGEGAPGMPRPEFGEFYNCHNPVCYGGGFSIGELLHEMVRREATSLTRTVTCLGYEGSPKGQRRYRSCLNGWDVLIEIEYKAAG